MDAVLLIGHGSLHPGSGAAMIRLAARLREQGVAPLSGAGFLNYSQPRLPYALERLLRQGATRVAVLPYFLVPGKFVRDDLARQVQAARVAHPAIEFALAAPFGLHSALADLLERRALAAAPPDSAPQGLLVLAHGSPHPESNAPIFALAELLAARPHWAAVDACFMDLNAPLIGAAIDAQVARGLTRLVAAPYFLQLGGHVREDLPAAIAAARARHPHVTIHLADHLGYDLALATVLAERAAAAFLTLPASSWSSSAIFTLF